MIPRQRVIDCRSTIGDTARIEAGPVVWVQHSWREMPRGSEAQQYVPELVREDSESLVRKEYGDSFECTDLESIPSGQGLGRLIVTDAQTTARVGSTLQRALVRGYDATRTRPT